MGNFDYGPYQQLVAANWLIVAAFAWKSYLDYGRGAVGVDCTTPASAGKTKIFYLDLQTLTTHQVEGISFKEEKMVQDYSPQASAVICLLTAKGEVSSDCWWVEPKPPEAYEELKPRIDEFILKGFLISLA